MQPIVLALALAVGAAEPVVTFDVKRGGDVKWKSSACSYELFDADKNVVKNGEVSGGITLEKGKYDAVIGCESDEGTVKRSVPVVVKGDDVTVPVALDPGFLLVTVLRFDTPTRAEITVFDERGFEVAKSKEKAVILLVPGRFRVLAKVDEAGPRPVFGNAQATVVARQKTEVKVDTTDGELLVTISDNGRKAEGVAALRAPGQKTRLVELRTGEKGAVPPGTYDLVTQLDDTHDFSEVLTKNVVIAPAKLTQRSVAHRTGTVKPAILVNGKKLPDDAKVDIELSTPGAAGPFNTVSVGDVIKTASGTFEISAKRTDAPLDDGTLPTAKAKVSVSAGAQRGVTLDLASATIDVTTLVGGKPRALDVEVKAQGADTASSKKTSDADGKTQFALSAGRWTVRAILKAPQGDVVTQQNVSVALGSRLALKLNIDVGTAVVQVFEGGVAVPAEVRFYTRLKDGKPDGAPVLAVPAGQEALLPPGVYALFVRRKGEEKSYSEIKVAAGRTVDRSVEIAAPATATAPPTAPAPAPPTAPAPTPPAAGK